jgi:eukaryotic-like serine/threonine-protein kinase
MSWAWLNSYTRHNAKAVVPALKGLTLEEARVALAAVDLGVEVIDSVYNDQVPKSTVVEQDPDNGKEVKPDRTIYVVMNAGNPKMLDMPKLVNLSKRQAISVLDILGIKVKEIQYRPDPCTDCVVAQLYKGKSIAPETRIRRGESITLVLGSGMKGERVQVPDVRGMNLAEMKAVLNLASLNAGVIVACPGCNTPADTALARVARQTPEPYHNNMIGAGGMIDVWLTLDTTDLKPTSTPSNTAEDDENDTDP